LVALLGVTLAGCDATTLPFTGVPAQQCVAQRHGSLGAGGGVVVPLAAFDPVAKYHTSGLYAVRADSGTLAWSCASTTYVGWDDAQLVNGTLYAIAGTEYSREGPMPTHVHGLYAIRPQDGKQLWAYSFQAGSTSALAFDKGTIFISSVTTDGASEHSNLYAVATTSGALAWKESFGDTVGQPMIAGGHILLMVNDPSGPQLRALSERDGSQLWSVALPSPAAASSLIMAGGQVAYYQDATITMLDATSGRTLWTHDAPANITRSLVAASGALFFATSQSVLAYDSASGALRWSAVLGANPWVEAATAQAVYVVTQTADGQPVRAFALAASSGDILWQRGMTSLSALALGGADPYLLIPTGANKLTTLVALDTQGGERWRYDSQNPYNIAALIPHGANLYYIWQGLEAGVTVNPTTITYVTCLRAVDGSALWTTPLPALNTTFLQPLLVAG
jgi:outer membrane protein assembly factor BamB